MIRFPTMSPAAKSDGSKSPSAVKKRRVGGDATAAVAASSSDAVPAKPKPLNKSRLYAEVSQLEEAQSAARSGAQDAQMFGQACQEIRHILQQILDLKVKKGAKASKEIGELGVTASLHCLTLKKLNRLDKLRTRASRDATQQAKLKVDALNLQLQNLLYEVLHLQKEITKCHQFKSKDEEIDLISVEEFYRQAPESIAKPDETQEDEHAQYLARLEFENVQRKEKNEAYLKFESARSTLEKNIKEKRTKLASLKPQLQVILEKTKPVQSYLDLPLTEERDQLQLARYLPHALFVLYSKTSAYGRACDSLIKVTILGDLDEVKRYKATKKALLTRKDDEDDDEDDDDENNATQEEDDEGKKSRGSDGGGGGSSGHKSAGASSSGHGKGHGHGRPGSSCSDDKEKKLQELHPLRVALEVKLAKTESPGEGGSVTGVKVTFAYLDALKIVGASVELMGGSRVSGGEKEVLQPSNLLSHLFERDPGTHSPNPSTRFHLSQVGLRKLPLSIWDTAGSPYLWTQHLAGLEFVRADSDSLDDDSLDVSTQEVEVSPDEEVSHNKIEVTIKAIRARLVSRLALQRQISQLNKAKMLPVELETPAELDHLFPPSKPTSRIRNWSSVDWEQYTALEVTQHLTGAAFAGASTGAVDGDDFFYRLQVNREPATLIALIAVKPDYPVRAPVFCLNLHWNGEHNLHNSERVRELECLINTGFSDLPRRCRQDLLSLQLRRLLACLDIMLESWNVVRQNEAGGTGGGERKADFPRERLFLHPVRGRTRSLPLVYQSKLQVYSQR